MARTPCVILAALLLLIATPPAFSQYAGSGCFSLTIGSTGISCGASTATTVSGLTLSDGALSGTTTLPGSGQLSNAGNLGLGAASSGQKLEVTGATVVKGAVTANQTSSGALDFASGGARLFGWGAGGVDGKVEVFTGQGAAGATSRAKWDVKGTYIPFHLMASGASAPALTSCGTSPAISGDDKAGLVTMGTGTPTGCVITFATAYSAAPYCTVTWQTNIASMQYVVSATAITLTQTATSSNKVNYVCFGQSGG